MSHQTKDPERYSPGLGMSPEQVAQTIEQATRANGSFIVNLLFRYALWLENQIVYPSDRQNFDRNLT